MADCRILTGQHFSKRQMMWWRWLQKSIRMPWKEWVKLWVASYPIDWTDIFCRDIISASPNFIKLTDTTYYIINVLDYFIGLYCHTRAFNPTGINNVEYQHILTIVFITVLNYITQREHDTKLHISNEKIQYYLICQKLITAFPNSFSDCIPLLEVIKNWERELPYPRYGLFPFHGKSLYLLLALHEGLSASKLCRSNTTISITPCTENKISAWTNMQL